MLFLLQIQWSTDDRYVTIAASVSGSEARVLALAPKKYPIF